MTYQRECSACGGRFDLCRFPLVFDRRREKHRFFKRCLTCHSAQSLKSQRNGRLKAGVNYLQQKRRESHVEAVRLGRTQDDWETWMRRQCPLFRWSTQAMVAIRIIPRKCAGSQRKRKFPDSFYRLSSAERFAWRYEHDDRFAERQRLRTTMRRWVDTRYAVRTAGSDAARRYHDARDRQLGRVTRAHIRRELTAKWCSYCLGELTPGNRQLDHVVPISANGMHDDSNIVAACASCNASKGSRDLLAWLIARSARKPLGSLERRP